MTTLTNKEMAAHIRKLVKLRGIKARVRISPAADAVQIITPTYEAKFTSDECREIAFIADCNKLTMVRGDAINVANAANLTGANEFTYYLPR